MPESLLERARGYLRTANAALANGDLPPAYENARAACELAAKHLLDQAAVKHGKEHNVAAKLVQAGLWPGGVAGRRLSRLLGDATRGVYGFSEPIHRRDVEQALTIAQAVIAKAGETR